MNVLVHKAVEPKNLSKAGKERLQRLLMVGDYILQPKYDGVYVQFVADQSSPLGWAAYSRTGERLLSVPRRILEELQRWGDPKRRYMGELWALGRSHSEINGMARKHTEQPGLDVRMFDSYDESKPQERYRDRLAEVWLTGLPLPSTVHTELVNTWDDLILRAKRHQRAWADAYDGLILRDPNGLFVHGAGKDGETIKVKPRKSGDFRVIGVVEGKGKAAGMAGALVLDLGGGVTCEVGTGMADVTRHNYWDWFRAGPKNSRIAEIEYLDITKDGKLREPSFKSTRWDKAVPDVLPGNIKGDD